MEIFGNQTPKKSLMKSQQNFLYEQNSNSSNLSFKRINSLIPSNIFKNDQNNFQISYKESVSIKKSCKIKMILSLILLIIFIRMNHIWIKTLLQNHLKNKMIKSKVIIYLINQYIILKIGEWVL